MKADLIQSRSRQLFQNLASWQKACINVNVMSLPELGLQSPDAIQNIIQPEQGLAAGDACAHGTYGPSLCQYVLQR